MDLGSSIPQFFYDVIARLIPGSVILVIYCYIFGYTSLGYNNEQILFNEISIPFSIALILFFIIAYSLGMLLNGIGYTFSERLWEKFNSTAENLINNNNLATDSDVKKRIIIPTSYKYDSIQLYFPRVGSRIAKLSAEKNFCRSLLSGFVLLFIIYGIFSPIDIFGLRFVGTEIFFLLAFMSCYFLYKHISSRSTESIRNNWILLNDAREKNLISLK